MKLQAMALTLLTVVAAFWSGESISAEPVDKSVSCTEKNGIIEVKFINSIIPDNFTVLRPDEGMVFISGENAGKNYSVEGVHLGTLQINPKSQLGVQFTDDGSKQPRLVFDDPGTYTLLFSNPGEVQSSTEGTSCKINISATGSATVAALAMKNLNCSSSERVRVDCLSSSGCQSGGHGYCCSHTNRPESPCYCNNCCVALTAQAVMAHE